MTIKDIIIDDMTCKEIPEDSAYWHVSTSPLPYHGGDFLDAGDALTFCSELLRKDNKILGFSITKREPGD